MPKFKDRQHFHRLCQQVVDHIVENGEQQMQYGCALGAVKAQHMSAIIETLRQYGAVEPTSIPDVFKVVSPVYRLYYTREFEMLIAQHRKERCIYRSNWILAITALLSAIFSGISLFFK